jgi:hypothetical protein
VNRRTPLAVSDFKFLKVASVRLCAFICEARAVEFRFYLPIKRALASVSPSARGPPLRVPRHALCWPGLWEGTSLGLTHLAPSQIDHHGP